MFFRQRKNIVLSDQERTSHVLLEFPSYTEVQSSKHTQNRSCDYTNLFLSTKNWSTKICSNFSNHGHCTLGKRCPQSHDIDLIVLSKEVEVTKKDRKRKRSPPLPEKQKDVQNNTAKNNCGESDAKNLRKVNNIVDQLTNTTTQYNR